MLKLMAKVQAFFDDGHLMMKKQNVHFNTKTNKKRMMTVPFGENKNEIIAHYLKSDDGIETLKFLEKLK